MAFVLPELPYSFDALEPYVRMSSSSTSVLLIRCSHHRWQVSLEECTRLETGIRHDKTPPRLRLAGGHDHHDHSPRQAPRGEKRVFDPPRQCVCCVVWNGLLRAHTAHCEPTSTRTWWGGRNAGIGAGEGGDQGPKPIC